MDAAVLVHEAAPKAAFFIALAIAIGTVVTRRLMGRDLLERTSAGDRLSMLAVAAGAGLLVATWLRLLGHTVAAFGPADAWSTESIHLIAMESRWGESWRLQLLTASAFFAAAVAVRVRGGRGWRWSALAAVACCLTTPLLGHAAGSAARGTLHAAHVLGSSAWLGTLIAVVLLDRMSARAAGRAGVPAARIDHARLTATLVERFSPVALTAAAVVFSTGVLAAFFYLTTPADLLQTAYGRALTIKLTIVLAILVCGYANWRRARAREAPWTALLRVEAALAVLVLVVTSVLTELEHP